ncbi:EF-hand domain-containing protein [Shimia abyssi]|uniref:EF hand domain-containing protein n=1 Tax=Shimia abyssi TaxID=1662395 RepID=A0A2P8FHJ6_9RHOB|nr:EF-hand domain-containing protein [Shimia abyssi]PSL21177.1 EF hand domain-containing protein [Shimia abyssi]
MTRFLPPIAALALVATQATATDASFLENWDLDDDGGVTWTELEDLQRKIFSTYDIDGDGALNSEEYTAFDKDRAATAEATGDAHHRLAVHGMARNRFDTNLDGLVTFEEFQTGLRNWFNKNDGNKNGILESGDY